MTEEDDPAFEPAQTGDAPVGSGTDIRDRFSPRAAVAEQVPVRPLLADLRRRQAFVPAVVPLEQVRVELGLLPEPGELAGPLRPLASD